MSSRCLHSIVLHGDPDIVIGNTPARYSLESMSDLIAKTKAIVIVSVHFETDDVVMVTYPHPSMIYNFGGLHTSSITWSIRPPASLRWPSVCSACTKLQF